MAVTTSTQSPRWISRARDGVASVILACGLGFVASCAADEAVVAGSNDITGGTAGVGGAAGTAGGGNAGTTSGNAGTGGARDAGVDAIDAGDAATISSCPADGGVPVLSWADGPELAYPGSMSAVSFGDGWLAFSTDTGNVFVGTPDGSVARDLGRPMLDAPLNGALAVEATTSPKRAILVGGRQLFVTHWAALSQVALYDLELDLWAILPSLPAPRHAATAFVFDERLYVAGGAVSDQDGPTRSVYRYDLSQGFLGDWEELPLMPEPRADAGAAWVGGKLVIVGGRLVPSSMTGVFATTTLIYDPVTAVWSKIPGPAVQPGQKLQWFSVVDHCGGILAGGDDELSAGLNVVWRNPASESWETLSAPPLDRDHAALVLVHGTPWLLGGTDRDADPDAPRNTTYVGQLVNP